MLMILFCFFGGGRVDGKIGLVSQTSFTKKIIIPCIQKSIDSSTQKVISLSFGFLTWSNVIFVVVRL